MRSFSTTILVLLIFIACSDGPADPKQSGPGVEILAGDGLTDTISTSPTQGLVVRVLDENARPAVGVEVRFEVPAQGLMQVSRIGDASYATVASATTDAAGRATVRVRMSTRAGAGRIAVVVPLYNLTDTARYTILPGAATRVTLGPRDTTVALGGRFTYRGGVVDRANNTRPGDATYEVVGQSVQVNANSGALLATAMGTSRVRVRGTISAVALADSTTVTVIPEGRVASAFGELVVNDLTGANRQVLAPAAEAPMWEPGGSRIVFAATGLFIANVDGTVVPLPTPGITNPNWPEWSVDRQWLYFQGGGRIWRIHPDASGLGAVSAPGVAAGMPTPSPDGRNVAYVVAGTLVIQDVASGAWRTIVGATEVEGPRWSPDGQWIAYTKRVLGELMLVRPDGTSLRRVGAHGLYPGISWSPDSRWIIGTEERVTLVELNSGSMSYLPWRGATPSWRR